MHKSAQFRNGFVFFTGVGKIVVVQTHNEGRRTTCLTGQTREIRERCDGADLYSLRLDGLCKISNAETRNVFRMVVLVNDDDREMVFHIWKAEDAKKGHPA